MYPHLGLGKVPDDGGESGDCPQRHGGVRVRDSQPQQRLVQCHVTCSPPITAHLHQARLQRRDLELGVALRRGRHQQAAQPPHGRGAEDSDGKMMILYVKYY